MDLDFWAARVHSSNHHLSAVPPSCNSGAHLTIDDAGEDDIRAWFPCPFCYVEIKVPALCTHLQEEHCFDLKNAVCPICAANLGKDAIGHFTMQHAHSVKKRRKTQRPGLSSNASSMVGKDFRELTSFIGSNVFSYKSDKHEPAPDPLLSPFICSSAYLNSKDSKQDVTSGDTDSTADSERKPSLSDALQEQDYEERMKQAAFCQELIMSTIF